MRDPKQIGYFKTHQFGKSEISYIPVRNIVAYGELLDHRSPPVDHIAALNFSLSILKDAYSSSLEALSVHDGQIYKAREIYDPFHHRLLTGSPVVLTG